MNSAILPYEEWFLEYRKYRDLDHSSWMKLRERLRRGSVIIEIMQGVPDDVRECMLRQAHNAQNQRMTHLKQASAQRDLAIRLMWGYYRARLPRGWENIKKYTAAHVTIGSTPWYSGDAYTPLIFDFPDGIICRTIQRLHDLIHLSDTHPITIPYQHIEL